MPFDPDLLAASAEVVADGVTSGVLPSGVLAVAGRDGDPYVRAYGPVREDSQFLIASISKPIFATAVMRLVERGKLRLNEPVARSLPELATNGKADVRLWHLLTHTSGLDEAPSREAFGRGLGRPEVAAAACAAGLLFKPGSRYQYCNASFGVMAEMVSRVSGLDDVTFLRDQVLAPLGMRDTAYLPMDPERAAPVHSPPWADERGRDYWMSLSIPAGGLWSTAADLVRFGRAFLNDGAPVLTPAAVAAMTALQTAGIEESSPAGSHPAYYGLGFLKAGPHSARGPSAELRTATGFGHGGATGTLLWIEPGYDLIFVFLTNRWSAEPTTQAALALNAAIAAASRG